MISAFVAWSRFTYVDIATGAKNPPLAVCMAVTVSAYGVSAVDGINAGEIGCTRLGLWQTEDNNLECSKPEQIREQGWVFVDDTHTQHDHIRLNSRRAHAQCTLHPPLSLSLLSY